MASSLRSRLALSRGSAPRGSAPRGSAARRSADGPRRGLPAGWTEASEGLWTRSVRFDLPDGNRRGEVDLSAFSRRLSGRRVDVGDIVFFDLETTGLSGGAGTVAFLAAAGSIRPEGALEVVQYFMDDYPAEYAFVERVRGVLAAPALASYNGASFDLPLLRTRCVMNGIPAPDPRPHADVLHPARRLFGGVYADCSLGTLEREALGMDRGPDIPGAEVPEAWFRFLRTGMHPDLDLVFSHNASDVLALARLFLLVLDAVEGRCRPRCDPLGLAELMTRAGNPQAEGVLKEALDAGYPEAVRPLMRLYWKAGRRDERLALSRYLPEDAAGLLQRSLYEERVVRDDARALELAAAAREAALADGDSVRADRAGRRAARLAARLAARPG